MKPLGNLAPLLEAFFGERLLAQRHVSPHTIASYRDSFRLLLEYAEARLGKAPSDLSIEDLDAPFIGRFLDHIEKERGNGPRTRNLRLTAIHSFFRYAAFQKPERSQLIQRVLAIPAKRFVRKLVGYLSHPELQALLGSPDQSTWMGRRDHALLVVALQTGLRVSELTSLRCKDVVLGSGAHVRCEGKGRKERATPLGKKAVSVLRTWLKESSGAPADPVFPSARGGPLSRDGVEYLLAKHVTTARKSCATLRSKRVSPHVLRHSTAMQLLHAGVDRSVIALWLGHESPETTQIYIDADLALKEKLVEKAAPPGARRGRFQAGDKLLAFLKGL